MKVKDCSKCHGCPLARLFPERNFIPPKEGRSLRLAVAEAGGAEEELMMEPLVGSCGKTMNSLWRKGGVSRDEITITNTLCCRPPDNIYPTDAAARRFISEDDARESVSHCYKSYLKPLLDSRPWERIDAIGEKALRVLTGKTEGIFKWRGSPLPLIGQTKPVVMPMLHPSYLQRDQSMIPATISDIQKGVTVPPQNYNLQPTVEELEAFHAKTLVFDIETNRFSNQITMVGITANPYRAIVVPFRGVYISQLRRIFEEAEEVVGQNIIGFDLDHLAECGIKPREGAQIWDVMLMHHLVQPDSPHDLEFIASIFTQMQAWKHLNTVDMQFYNACDVDATCQIYEQLRPLLDYMNLTKLYKYCQVPLAKICKKMEETGIKVDPSRLGKVRERFIGELKELEGTLPPELQPHDKPIRKRERAPEGTLGKSGKPIKFIHIPSTERVVPWQSPKIIERYLYETLHLPKQLHRKTKHLTTDKYALERLFRQTGNKTIDTLRKLRSLEELIGTFLQDGDENEQVATGRIHTNFLVHGTNTGRLASSSPNLQNIPTKARFIYVPSHADWCFVEADFSSLENRLAAWYANDDDRLARLANPEFNEHKWLCSKIYGIPESEVDKSSWQYKRAKNTNHGADGAMGWKKLSDTYDIPAKESKELLVLWRTINHKSADWQERTGNEAAREGVLTNIFSRKRWFWSHSAYTEGIRFFPQSTGADICFRAMIAMMYERIQWPEELARKVAPILCPLPHPARLVLQVHDSLLVECPLALVDEVAFCMKTCMEQPWPELAGYSIPAAFKVGAPGDSWAELKDYNFTGGNHNAS